MLVRDGDAMEWLILWQDAGKERCDIGWRLTDARSAEGRSKRFNFVSKFSKI